MLYSPDFSVVRIEEITRSMPHILIVFAHPALEKSRVHRKLIQYRPDHPELTFHDLYEEYPSFSIDVEREQALLSSHDLIVLQHPLFWYSTPPLLKQWMDLVLEHGWAYGSTGSALHGKRVFTITTAGGREAAYDSEGYNRFTIRQFLAPIEQTCRLCGMDYSPPYVIFGTHGMTSDDIQAEAVRYRRFLEMLLDDRIDVEAAGHKETLNLLIRDLSGQEDDQ
jgi:glutathione-regulated potassium-efflux system ancillary protein KefG